MQRTERGASLEMPFRVPRQVAISSERRSFEPAWVKRNHTDLHTYNTRILWFTSLSSAFSAPSPLGVLVCRPSTTHYGLVFSFVSSSIPLLLPSPLPPRLVLLFVHRAVGEPTVKLRIPFLWESWQIIAIFEKFGTIFFQGDFIEKKALAPDLVYGLPVL